MDKEAIKSWIRKNITGERGPGYVDDYAGGKGTEGGDDMEVPSVPPAREPGQNLLQYGGGVLLDMVQGIVTDTAIKVLKKVAHPEEK